jgi:protein tyrosine phosphatase (PTP) superfamily phosphohydrolase (DUF442 family)
MKLFLTIAVGMLFLQAVYAGASKVKEEQIKDTKKEDIKERPAKWAKAVKLKGAPNLHKVSDILYRSAQPSKEGMKNLKDMGIKTIVNLRSFHSDRDEIGDTKLQYEHIYMKAWHPEKKEVIRFIKIVSDPKNQPVLVHCQHGADRTGTMCAVYRMVFQDWSKEDAIEEMKEGGYNFHSVWVNLEPWIKKLDVEKLKKEIGK